MLSCASVYWCLVFTCWEGLTSWLSFVMSNCEVVTFPLASCVGCGAWLYWILIFALCLTLKAVETLHGYQWHLICHTENLVLTHISLVSFLWDICKQCKPRSETKERGVWSGSPLFAYRKYSKTSVKRPLKKDRKLVFKTKYRLMQVRSIAECFKGSILQYFRPSLIYHLSLRSLFCLLLSGRFTQFLLYV